MSSNYEIVQAWLRRDPFKTDEQNMQRIAFAYNVDVWEVVKALREEGFLP